MVLTVVPTTVFAVDFDFTDLTGEKHKLSDYKGKWVIVNFWATWCPPCRHELPDLSDYHLENEDAVVIGVNYEPGVKDEKLKKFTDVYLISYPITRVNDDIISELGEPRGLPTSIIISPEGDIAKRITGMVDERSLNKMISSFQQ
jgi:thiol-disulfide isomerase/thioredoxin